MEVLLFALFFISALVFFIAGKDDFGRTDSNLRITEEENIKEQDKVAEEIKKENKVAEEIKKKDKIAGEGNIELQKELNKES